MEKQFGVVIELLDTPTGEVAAAALAGDSAQLCACSALRTVNAVEAGQDYRAIFNGYSGSGNVLVAAKKFESTVRKDISGFRDATWAYTSEGGNTAILAEQVATANGLDWARVKRVTIGDAAAFAPALQTGQAEIIAMDSGSAARVIKAGIGYVVMNSNELAVQREFGFLIGTPLIAKVSFLDENRDIARAIVAALQRELAWLKAAGPDQVLPKMTPEFQASRADAGSWSVEWQIARPALEAVDGTFSERQIADTLNAAVSSGAVDRHAVPSLGAVFSNEFVQTL